MPLDRDPAICIRRLDFSETSQVVALFSRSHGLLKALAKGAKRTTKAGHGKFDGGLDLLDLGDAVFLHSPEKELSTLTEWTLLDGHLALRDNLRGMYLAQYAAELVPLLFHEHDPHPDVFDDLAGLIPLLCTESLEESFLAFELRLLYAAGVMPELHRCVSCQKPLNDTEPSFFTPAGGGIACVACESGYPDRAVLDPRYARLFRGMARTVLPPGYPEPSAYRAPRPTFTDLKPPRLLRHHVDPAHRLLLDHLRNLTGKSPRLAEYVLDSDPHVWRAKPITRPARRP